MHERIAYLNGCSCRSFTSCILKITVDKPQALQYAFRDIFDETFGSPSLVVMSRAGSRDRSFVTRVRALGLFGATHGAQMAHQFILGMIRPETLADQEVEWITEQAQINYETWMTEMTRQLGFDYAAHAVVTRSADDGGMVRILTSEEGKHAIVQQWVVRGVEPVFYVIRQREHNCSLIDLDTDPLVATDTFGPVASCESFPRCIDYALDG